MGFFLGNCVGKHFGVDQVEVSADAAQSRAARATVASSMPSSRRIDVYFGIDVAIGMGELDDAPWRIEGPGDPVVMQVKPWRLGK